MARAALCSVALGLPNFAPIFLQPTTHNWKKYQGADNRTPHVRLGRSLVMSENGQSVQTGGEGMDAKGLDNDNALEDAKERYQNPAKTTSRSALLTNWSHKLSRVDLERLPPGGRKDRGGKGRPSSVRYSPITAPSSSQQRKRRRPSTCKLRSESLMDVAGKGLAPLVKRPKTAMAAAAAGGDAKLVESSISVPQSPPSFPADVAAQRAAEHRETPNTPYRGNPIYMPKPSPEPQNQAGEQLPVDTSDASPPPAQADTMASAVAANGGGASADGTDNVAVYSDLSEDESPPRDGGRGSPSGDGSARDGKFADDPEAIVKEPPPKLTGRYTLVEYLGHGSYGHVYGGLDMRTGEKVAIKRITGVFDDVMHAKRLLRELRILRVLRHDHIIELRDILPPRDINDFRELYIVFEFADTDMLKLINSDQHFSTLHVQFFFYQVLMALRYVHSANIIHRDLKPANILINQDCSLLLCDLGLARGMHQSLARADSAQVDTNGPKAGEDAKVPARPAAVRVPAGGGSAAVTRQLTKHVVTRWYRAPELILLESNYSSAIDMWSAGCILSELLSMQASSVRDPSKRRALFPGKSCFPLSADNPLAYTHPDDQLAVIFDVIGTPRDDDIQAVSSQKARQYLESLPRKQPKNLSEMFPGSDPDGIDLLSKLLCFNPHRRLTAAQALRHPFLSKVREATAERAATSEPIYFEFEDVPITKSMIKDLIIKEVLFYNPHLAAKLRGQRS